MTVNYPFTGEGHEDRKDFGRGLGRNCQTGKFGETPDDVLRRVFKIDERRNPMEGLKAIGRPRYATKRQSPWVSNNALTVEYEDGLSKSWPLPPPA